MRVGVFKFSIHYCVHAKSFSREIGWFKDYLNLLVSRMACSRKLLFCLVPWPKQISNQSFMVGFWALPFQKTASHISPFPLLFNSAVKESCQWNTYLNQSGVKALRHFSASSTKSSTQRVRCSTIKNSNFVSQSNL